MKDNSSLHWKDAQDIYRINHLTKLCPGMLSREGHTEVLENKGKGCKDSVLFDREFVHERFYGLFDDLQIYSLDDAMTLMEEILVRRNALIETRKKQSLDDFINKYGKEAVMNLLSNDRTT